MALIGVHVERPVRLGKLCAAIDAHEHSVRFDGPQKLDKLRVRVERPVRLVTVDITIRPTQAYC